MTTADILKKLHAIKINTWFDLDLFLDKLREEREKKPVTFPGGFISFKKHLKRGGLAFISYYFSVDGVTVEIKKYAAALEKMLKGLPIHLIAGSIEPSIEFPSQYTKHQIPEIDGFKNWPLYNDFFFKKLKRGNKAYNRLIKKFWQDTLVITQSLGDYIEKNNIKILWLVNTHSNPGNIALTLALTLLSEYFDIPVIANNHDFYWEGGHRKIDILMNKAKPGPRDFFFKNSDVGEFFSLLHVLFPWESRFWLSANINKPQSKYLIKEKGHNPANVCEVTTAIDLHNYYLIDESRKIEVQQELTTIFSGPQKKARSSRVSNFKKNQPIKTKPIIIGLKKNVQINFINNIIFLQPTRIIERKKIEFNFELLKELFNNKALIDYFRKNKKLQLTILVTGPIAPGHDQYFLKIINSFKKALSSLDQFFHDKIFLAFLFREIDKNSYKKKSKNPITIYDLYNCASLVLLPSETEGRGLPIIEAAAARVPIFTRRYYPLEVYAEVIGKKLDDRDRLRVIDFQNDYISNKKIENIIDRLIHPLRYLEEAEHNYQVVKRRFSPDSLQKNINTILHTLYKQLNPDFAATQLSAQILTRYYKRTKKNRAAIINSQTRQHLAGYGKLAYMLYLKSLIDPSFFRVEEQETKGLIMNYARKLIYRYAKIQNISYRKVHNFYNCVEQFFHNRLGTTATPADHTINYRHRNNIFYPYQQCTYQELTGAVNIAFDRLIKPHHRKVLERQKMPSFSNLHQAMLHLTDVNQLTIDHTELLQKRLSGSKPFVLFAGRDIADELEIFVVQPLRERLGVLPDEKITSQHLTTVQPVYIIAPAKYAYRNYTAGAIREYIRHAKNKNLQLFIKNGLCKIMASEQAANGVHFKQLGDNVLRLLEKIKKQKGFIVAIGEDSAMTTDIVDIDVFHIGRANRILTAKIMGIPQKSGFVEWIPAGQRPTLAYPVPVQTAKSFSDTLKSSLFKQVVKKLGRQTTLEAVKKETDTNGTPLKPALEIINQKISQKIQKDITYSHLTGIFKDGQPYSGVIAKINKKQSKIKWNFHVMCADKHPKPALDFLKDFNKNNNNQGRIVWNGGYILNAELIGKLGLSQSYIGSPLGLVITNNKIISPPLFNKPALLFYKDGSINIRRVNITKGLIISHIKKSNLRIELRPDGYNRQDPNESICYYDLMYANKKIPGNGRVICQLSGNIIKNIIFTEKSENIMQIPVGLTLSFPKNKFPNWLLINMEVKLEIKEFNYVIDAIEAGPQLIRSGRLDIKMEKEGWKTANSIHTQAARVDFEDMRGPKIAVGLDKEQNVYVLVINGRIRESVGASHHDMARILLKRGIKYAMGFDPGGSSTLVIDGQVLNLSPYNHNFEKDFYSLPAEPRPISNAIIGWQKK